MWGSESCVVDAMVAARVPVMEFLVYPKIPTTVLKGISFLFYFLEINFGQLY